MPNNILVIKLGALGDFFIALGAMQAIKKHHEGDKITLLTTKSFKAFAEKTGYFDEIMVTKRSSIFDIAEWFRMFKFFNNGNFSRVYDLQMQDRTKWYYRLFTKKPEWSGVIQNSPLAYKNPDWKKLHAFKRHEEILKVAGIKETPIPDISWMRVDVSEMLKKKGVTKPFIMLIPGSSAAHSEKRWPAIRYAGIALKFIKDGYDVVVAGGPDEIDLLEKIKKICPQAKILSPKTSFYDIYSVAEKAAGIIANDTGLGHISALTHKPIVSLFCSKKSSAELSAPIGKNVACIEAEDMDDISVKDVYDLLKPMPVNETTFEEQSSE